MLSIWSFFVQKKSFTYLLVISLVFAGLFSVIAIPKESAPEVQIPIAIVTTVLPGGSADDMEKLVTNTIEERLSSGLDDVKKITSTSGNSVSSIVVEFNADADLEKSIQKVKDEVDIAKRELPGEAEDPVVSEVNFVDQPVLLFSVSSDLPITELIRLADMVEDEIKAIPGVSRVVKSGIPQREVQVIVSKEALNNFGIQITDVVRALSLANSSIPVGDIQVDGIEYAVRFEGDIENTSEIADIAIATGDGRPVYIRDIAFVSDGVSKATSFSRTSIGGSLSEQSVSFAVFKTHGGDVTRLTSAVRERLSDLQETILIDSEVLSSFDTGEFVKDDLKTLSFTGLQTIILVMIILFLAIGWRASLVAGSAIPLSFLIAFIGLSASGNTINFVSLFSLILAVGILVDSAIVVTEGMYKRVAEDGNKVTAAYNTLREFHWPITSGTMTTVAVFAPLFFISGVTGEFIASIPFTIIFVLLASLFVALAIVPLFASIVLRADRQVSTFSAAQEYYFMRLQTWYKKKLLSVLGVRKRERNFIVGIMLLLVVSIAFPITGIVDVIFFPDGDEDFLFVDIEGREGTTLGETDLLARAVEDILIQNDVIASFTTTVGASSSFSESSSSGSRFANMTLILSEDRKKTSLEIVTDLRSDLRNIPHADVRVFQPSGGPPAGAPVLVTFLGDDTVELEAVAIRARDILKGIPGTTEVDSSIRSDGIDFVFRIDRAKAAEAGQSPSSIAGILRTAVHGTTATTIQKNGEDIDVVVKLNVNADYLDPHDTTRTTADAIRFIEVQTQNGPVLLGSFLDTYVEKSTAYIRHEDRKRVASVTSELEDGIVASSIVSAFEEKKDELLLPTGVTMNIGGETEDVDQSFRDMFVALIAGMVLILAILVLQFNSFRYAFYIISVVPFTLIGIFAGLAISRLPLSFPSIMGFIALAGIVVNNSIILIDVMNRLRVAHPSMPIRDVVLEGASSRLRPILLTTLTTVIGIVPLTYASALWAPLAFAIMFGLSFAVLITLVLIPILYDRWPGKI